MIDDDRSGSEFMSLFLSAFFLLLVHRFSFLLTFSLSLFFIVLLMDWFDVLVSLRVSVSK